jgi:predicted Rossmann-fold nucleotide-binding protein
MNTAPTDSAGEQQHAEVPGKEIPVIAVFGGSRDDTTLEVAEEVGHQIGLSRAILLTGGDDPNATDLKGRVLHGAHVVAREDGAPAPWIGVVRKDETLDPEIGADGLSLILTPGGDHRRNYAEAELCDAAIAFGGKEGTSSEVVFCLALGKPLVLVGEPWLPMYPVISRADERKDLKKKAQGRVPLPSADDHHRLGPAIRVAYEKFDKVVKPSFKFFALPPKALAGAVVEAAIRAAKSGSHPDESSPSPLSTERAAIRQFRASLRSKQ